MKIRRVPVDEIKFAEYNPRIAGASFMHALRQSLDAYGLTDPLVYNERTQTLIGGHQRARELIRRGETELECVCWDFDYTNEQALNLALNKVRLEIPKGRSDSPERRESSPKDGLVRYGIWLDQEQHRDVVGAIDDMSDIGDDAACIVHAARVYMEKLS